jgi:ppGpp synthetase/RelA/SpoT-type nucleotidyltranferase
MTTEMISQEDLEAQINAYTAVRPKYVIYAEALEKALSRACKCSVPEALVQSRAKTLSSFAEKCVRKYQKDGVNKFTDLCGARVIVQTFEQVQAVRKFIEDNFKILEKEDKGLLLQEDEFGYRDMHYIVQIRRDRPIGLKEYQIEEIGDCKAEIQVRTWVQHAWADTLHDRMYKAKLKFSHEINRTGALLAAIMEDGDRTFSRLALEIDGMAANYSEYASKEKVDREIDILKLLLENESDGLKKAQLALQLSLLLAASGEYGKAKELLEDKACQKARGALRCEIELHFGHALCKANRKTPECGEFKRGQKILEEVVSSCECSVFCEVPNLRKQQNIKSRAHACLAWSYAQQASQPDAEFKARSHYQSALAGEPTNPYYLADVLCYEIYSSNNRDLAGSLQSPIAEAISTCREHALRNTEMPYACFTAGRLTLLLASCAKSDEQARQFGYEALGWYSRGIHHYLSKDHVVPPDVLESEKYWLRIINRAIQLPPQYSWSYGLLEIAAYIGDSGRGAADRAPLKRPANQEFKKLAKPVLVIAGGAGSMASDTLYRVKPLVTAALEPFSGAVIAGGTKIGIPGCVGDAAEVLKGRSKKAFSLVGYVKKKSDNDTPWHSGYDHLSKFGEDFSPEHLLEGWWDILLSDIEPEKVTILGFGGGELSTAEYKIGVALGAKVGVVTGTGGATELMAGDPLWDKAKNLFRLPADRSTIRAFAVKPGMDLSKEAIKKMAKLFHRGYVDNSANRLPPNMRPWHVLPKTYRKSNRKQAEYAIEILKAAGFQIRKGSGDPVIFEFNEADSDRIEEMAEMEHGRWNVERLEDGWRYGSKKDEALKLHDCIVPWSELPEDTKKYDRNAVKLYPKILAKVGFEIYRPPAA